MDGSVSLDQLVELAKYLGVGGALALLMVGVALFRRSLRIGGDVDQLLLEKDKQLAERDRRITALEAAVSDRQRALDRTLEVASTLRLVLEHGRPIPPDP